MADCDRFNWAIRKLYKRLLQLGANEIYPTGEADQQHPEGSVPFLIPTLDICSRLTWLDP